MTDAVRTENVLKAGTLLALETGEYSDYGVLGFFRVLKAFDGKDAIAAYLAEFPDEAKEYGGSGYKFVSWLCERGYIEDVDFMRWHIESYGCFERASEPKQDEKWWRK